MASTLPGNGAAAALIDFKQQGSHLSSLRAGIRIENRSIRQIAFSRNRRHNHTMVPPPRHISPDTHIRKLSGPRR
jgi:hypothetical protein